MKQHNIELDTGTLTGLEQSARQTTQALDGSVLAGKALSEYLQQAQAAAKALETSVSKIRRVLAGFDQINRLGAAITTATGSSSKKSTSSAKKQEQEDASAENTPDTSQLKEEITVLSRLQQVLLSIGNSLRSLWDSVLVPLGTWVKDTLCPVFSQSLSSALEKVTQGLSSFANWAVQVWQRLQSVTDYLSQSTLLVLQKLWEGFVLLLTDITQGGPRIRSCLENIGQVFTGLWGKVSPILEQLRSSWQQALEKMASGMASLSAKVNSALEGILIFLLGGFLPGWSEGIGGLLNPMKVVLNGIIGCLNKLLSALVGALNGVIGAANQLSFTVPSWVPGLGGRQFGLSMKKVTVPQIPYLAQGAVLPANRPFLAMVGDQRHGTNVEAPLTTIQQAVALVMEDQTAAILSGFQASLGVQREILEAVLGIQIGDDLIGTAAARYSRKQAVVWGGAL